MDRYGRIASVASRLKEAMDNAGKTQADLARETGISRATLSRYLSGQFEPKQIAVNKLAVALNVSEMWLWGCDVPMVKKETAPKDGLSEAKLQLLALAENCSEEEAERFLQVFELILGKK
jgi:transcriptional regulator with XRE-family HTH domain